jgi:2-C-methyl-D-erythritol 2,4-cyclodiphosphate synthase
MQYRNADSRSLLRMVYAKVGLQGWKIANADMTIVAQAPRMANYIPRMVETIAADLQSELNQINVKATTTERLGFAGREEGIACYAVVLLEKA